MLSDYGITENQLTMFCENQSAINIFKNLVMHSRTKNIKIIHHFIHELVKSKDLIIDYLNTQKQLADLFTKPLDNIRFEYLRTAIGMITLN